MPAECLSWPLFIRPSQPRDWPNNQGSHESSLSFFFKEAFTGMPRGPKDTWGSLNSLSQCRMCMQLGHLWPGKKRLCVYSLLWPAGPTGKPSFTATQVSVRKYNVKPDFSETILSKGATVLSGQPSILIGITEEGSTLYRENKRSMIFVLIPFLICPLERSTGWSFYPYHLIHKINKTLSNFENKTGQLIL